MNAKQLKAALDEFRKSVGPKAMASLRMASDDILDDLPVRASLYPFGMGAGDKGYVSVEADDFASAFEALKAKWEEHRSEYERQVIRDMALAIIRITAEFGACTDSALRAEFDAGIVAKWGDDACEAANKMASNGPFTISRMKGANAA